MNNEELKMPDEFFKQGLENFEAPYREGDWEEMRNLLDKSDKKRPFLFWFRRNKKTTITLITITMTSTILISALSILFSHGEKTGAQISKEIQTEKVYGNIQNELKYEKSPSAAIPEINAATKRSENDVTFAYPGILSETAETEAFGSLDFNAGTASVTNANVDANSTGILAADNENNGADGNDPVKKPVLAKNEEKGDVKTTESSDCSNIIRTAASNESPKNGSASSLISQRSQKQLAGTPYTTFRGPWLGIHFTMQMPQTPSLRDSNRQNFGFNVQLMSSNLLHRPDFGAHLGMDFGAQWYGRTKNYGVVLNNSELDSGFTRLSTHSLDFFARGHLEYGRYFIKPYVNAFAGPRFNATSQYTEAYRHKTDYENSDNTNAHTSVSMMYGAAVGVRVAVSRHVSLDARWEFMRGTEATFVDLDNSTFNSLSTFDLSKFQAVPEYQQFKFGVLFDLWDSYEEKEYEPLTNDEVVQVNEYYYFDSTTNQYIRVDCKCKETPVGSDTTKTRHAQFFDETMEDDPAYIPGTTGKTGEYKKSTVKTGRTSSGGIVVPEVRSGSSGSGKGSFPGIKSGGSGGVKIKN